MAESIEAFVKKLHEEGIEAGREEAARLRAEAEEQARQLLDDAKSRAKAIVDEATLESERIRSRTQTELDLAARDSVNRLHDALEGTLRLLLERPVREKLEDSEFLASLIREVVMRYVDADFGDSRAMSLNVPEDLRAELSEWVLQKFRQCRDAETPVDVRSSMSEAGFEYRIGDGTVELTVDSVVELIAGMVGPELRRLLKVDENPGGT